jgi:hypothetical protein
VLHGCHHGLPCIGRRRPARRVERLAAAVERYSSSLRQGPFEVASRFRRSKRPDLRNRKRLRFVSVIPEPDRSACSARRASIVFRHAHEVARRGDL